MSTVDPAAGRRYRLDTFVVPAAALRANTGFDPRQRFEKLGIRADRAEYGNANI